MDSTLPLVAIVLGVGLFGETVRTQPRALAGAAVGLLLLLAGIVGLDTSPVVRKQRIDERKRHDEAEKSGTKQSRR